MYSVVEKNACINLDDAKINTKLVKELSGEKLKPLLVDLRAIKSVTKEAREHFSMKNRKPNVIAIALVIESPISRMIGNFFINLSAPAVPTKLFNKIEEADSWLTTYLN